ncbi:transferase [Lithospermum erythrorhizon]|uniref:glutathione transferase n=1 Tax=Lithospermum erythrorhizon TaxID=34254 RepID=A0AAV3PV62_LITER
MIRSRWNIIITTNCNISSICTKMVSEVLPPYLNSSSSPPPLFDGTTRLYTNHQCPFAQRAWIVRNYKGLQDKIKLVPIDLEDRPAWYKEKVYPENKVPALEHNGKVIGESLDLVKYIDSNFEGPSLLPEDPDKRKFAEELISYSEEFNKIFWTSAKGDPVKDGAGAYDHLETALGKFSDGPFFLGEQFSQVDAVYAPFVERYQIYLQEVVKYDITAGRPKLATWIEEINKLDAYKPTKCDPKFLVELYKRRLTPLA